MKKNILTLIYTTTFAIFFAVALPVTVSSQAAFGTSVQVSPELPRAHEEFSIGLSSTETNLTNANISWYINGKLGLSGVGKIGFRSRTGSIGTQFNIRVVAEKAEGGQIIKNITIRPQEVDILWSSYSHTPPFYKGKAMPPSAGLITFTAMPNLVTSGGVHLDPQELVYTWSERGVVLGSSSGFGKQTITLENGQISERPLQLKVVASNFNGTIQAEQNITLPVNQPEIIFYKKHPLEGIKYSTVIGNGFTFSEDETIIHAEPFFFSIEDMVNGKIDYRWKINNRDITIPFKEQTNVITFRQSGLSGLGRISLDVENNNLPFKILQTAQKIISINLGN